jgi:hypothetical protein
MVRTPFWPDDGLELAVCLQRVYIKKYQHCHTLLSSPQSQIKHILVVFFLRCPILSKVELQLRVFRHNYFCQLFVAAQMSPQAYFLILFSE